jgi:hypothetical protein
MVPVPALLDLLDEDWGLVVVSHGALRVAKDRPQP